MTKHSRTTIKEAERLQRWEYKVIELTEEIAEERRKTRELPSQWFKRPNVEDVLNKYGSQGRDLIDVQTVIDPRGIVVIGFFKRAIK